MFLISYIGVDALARRLFCGGRRRAIPGGADEARWLPYCLSQRRFGARGAPVGHARSGRRARKRARTRRSCGASRPANVPESRWWRADAGEVETRSVGDRLVKVDAVPRGPSPKTFFVIKKLAEDRPWGHGRRIVAMVCFVGPILDREQLAALT